MAIKGFDRTQFEAILPTLLTPTTPIRSAEFLRGRERILEEIRRAFIQPGRHVFIHGDRGVGKTSLAQTAALEHQQSSAEPVMVGCDNASTFYRIARNIALKLRPTDPTITKSTTGGKVGFGWRILSAEAQKTIERGEIPQFKTIDDVVSAFGFLATQHSETPVVVIDEFERIKAADERMLFADFIKQVGDQSLPLKLIFCGIGSSLSDLLDAHHSCYRYLTAISLDRLGYQPRLEIIRYATSAVGLKVESTSACHAPCSGLCRDRDGELAQSLAAGGDDVAGSNSADAFRRTGQQNVARIECVDRGGEFDQPRDCDGHCRGR